MPGVEALTHDEIREALRLLGVPEPPTHRATAQRELRATLSNYGTVRLALDGAPPGARDAFVRLASDGPVDVETLLGRSWWGHGMLPPPLDWLQRRALIVVAQDRLVHAIDEAVHGFHELALPLAQATARPADAEPLVVEAAGCVVIAPRPGLLDRALTAPGAELRAVADTVAVSPKSPELVRAALRAAGVPLGADATVTAKPEAPALPGSIEEAIAPRAVRALLARAVAEGRQLRLEYYPSSRGGAATERVVDPWDFKDDLLRGWCHLRDGERTFAVDRIGKAILLPSALEKVREEAPGEG
ncbi:MAG TPA: WYL domain-containing protein [Egibacteraceae bacterium]|nr:WYL domain-containing protein [Egibacteraceae bacterium]